MTHEEIVADMIESIEQLTIACSSRVKPLIEDDEYDFIPDNLERWHDRKEAPDFGESTHIRLEREADRILQS